MPKVQYALEILKVRFSDVATQLFEWKGVRRERVSLECIANKGCRSGLVSHVSAERIWDGFALGQTYRHQGLTEPRDLGLGKRPDDARGIKSPDGCDDLACRRQGHDILETVTALENQKGEFR